jgi:hypothetical protein
MVNWHKKGNLYVLQVLVTLPLHDPFLHVMNTASKKQKLQLDEASVHQLLDGNVAPSVLWGSCSIVDAAIMQATELFSQKKSEKRGTFSLINWSWDNL